VGELTKDRTCWAFVSDSDEPRHLFDIVSAVDILRKRGVPASNLLVFTDYTEAALHLGPYGISHHSFADLPAKLSAVSDCDGVVFVATGHGMMDGIGATKPVLSPHQTIQAVRSIPGLKNGAILVCQCYAGIFDMMDATIPPELIMVGAVRLNPSVSASYKRDTPVSQQDGSPGLDAWLANIFMAAFFNWIAEPKDIDGDGRLSFADAYKYAGVKSNERLISIKSELYMEVRRRSSEIEVLRSSIQDKAKGGNVVQADLLSLIAKSQELQRVLETLHNHQEAWLLHAKLARETLLSF
jgi:hypothetical protein